MSFLTKSVATTMWVIATRFIYSFSPLSLGGSPLAYGLAPLLGAYGTTGQALFAYGLHTAITACTSHTLSLLMTLHLPTLCGTLFLTHRKSIRAVIPAFCAVLFLMHPIGSTCSHYILYWIPPLIIGLFPQQSFVLEALGATLTTHAVGSLLWIYTHKTSTLFWSTLFYQVWAERILLTTLLVAAYYSISKAHAFFTCLQNRRSSCQTGL